MSYQEILLDRQDGIAVITINRPKKANCMDAGLYREFEQVQQELHHDDTVKVIILTGAGDRAFCAGMDLSVLGAADGSFAQRSLGWFHEINNRWERHSRPVIAAINGAAVGGGLELALACDLRVAAETAVLSIPEVRLGLAPDLGGSQRLTRLVGPARAKMVILTGDNYSAARALELGMVDLVVPRDKLMEESFKLAAKIAGNAPLAVRFAKRAINLSSEVSLTAGLMFEELSASYCLNTEDKKEAVLSYVEKRKPNFKGR
ncbi:MAG: enoyl-CoA hydratase-related protein [Bacillota bacterium]|jgi:enoyl-CoA hydratase